MNVDFSGLSEGEIPDEIRGAACDLRSLSGGDFSVCDVAAAGGRRSFGLGKYLGRTGEEFEKFDWLKGRRVNAEAGAEKFCGVARGVDSRGRLRVALEDGGEKVFVRRRGHAQKGLRPEP